MTGGRGAKGKRKGKGSAAAAATEMASDRNEGVDSTAAEVRNESKRRSGSPGAAEQRATPAATTSGWLSCVLVVSIAVGVGAAACVFYGDAILLTLEKYGVDTDSVLRGLYPKGASEDAAPASAGKVPPSSAAYEATPGEREDSVSSDNSVGPSVSTSRDELPIDDDEATLEQREKRDEAAAGADFCHGVDSEEPAAAEAAAAAEQTYKAVGLDEVAAPADAGLSVGDGVDDVILTIGEARDVRPPADGEQAASPAAAEATAGEETHEARPIDEPAAAAAAAASVAAASQAEGIVRYVQEELEEPIADAHTADVADFSSSPEYTSSPEDSHLTTGYTSDSEVPSQPETETVANGELPNEAETSQSEAEAVLDGELPFEEAPSLSDIEAVAGEELPVESISSIPEADALLDGEEHFEAAPSQSEVEAVAVEELPVEAVPSQPEAEPVLDGDIPVEAAPPQSEVEAATSQSDVEAIVDGELHVEAAPLQSEVDAVANEELPVEAMPSQPETETVIDGELPFEEAPSQSDIEAVAGEELSVEAMSSQPDTEAAIDGESPIEAAPLQSEAESVGDVVLPIDAVPSQSGAEVVIEGEMPLEAVPSQAKPEGVDNGEFLGQATRDMEIESKADVASNEEQLQVDVSSNDDDVMAGNYGDYARKQALSDAFEPLEPEIQGEHEELIAKVDSTQQSSGELDSTSGPSESFDAAESSAPAHMERFAEGEAEPISVASPDAWKFVDTATESGTHAPDIVSVEDGNNAGPTDASWKPVPAVDSASVSKNFDLKIESVASIDDPSFPAGDSRSDHEDVSASAPGAWDSVNIDPPSSDLSSSSRDLGGHDTNPEIALESVATEATSEYASEDNARADDETARPADAASAYDNDRDNILRLYNDEALRMAESASEYADDDNILRVKYSQTVPTLNVDGDAHLYADIDARNLAPAAEEVEATSTDGYSDTEIDRERVSASAQSSDGDGRPAADSEPWASALAADSAEDYSFGVHSYADSQDGAQGQLATDGEPAVPSASHDALAAEGDSATISAPQSHSSSPPLVPEELQNEAKRQEDGATTS